MLKARCLPPVCHTEGCKTKGLKHQWFSCYLCNFFAFNLPSLMYILAISVKRNQTGCGGASGYLRKAVQRWKDFSVCSGQVGVWIEKNECSVWTARPFCLCPFMIHSVHERLRCLWSVCSFWGADCLCGREQRGGHLSPAKQALKRRM